MQNTLTFPLRLCLLLVALLSFNAYSVDTPPSVENILAKLTNAMRHQSFRGVFTYEHGGSLETLDLTHVIEGGVEHERYVLLNGPEQALALTGRDPACESLAGRMLRGATLATEKGEAIRFHEYYHLYFKGYDRVAGRRVAVIQMLPKDDARYGMSLGVDVESGILLKALILSHKKVLERMQFVAFELNPSLQDDERQAVLSAAVSPSKRCAERDALDDAASESIARWQPSWVPKGFTLAASRRTDDDGIVHTYTDGLAAFSVFANPDLVPNNEEVDMIPRGVAQRGATLLLMDLRRIDSQLVHVTLVGEVPEKVALRILHSVHGRMASGENE